MTIHLLTVVSKSLLGTSWGQWLEITKHPLVVMGPGVETAGKLLFFLRNLGDEFVLVRAIILFPGSVMLRIKLLDFGIRVVFAANPSCFFFWGGGGRIFPQPHTLGCCIIQFDEIFVLNIKRLGSITNSEFHISWKSTHDPYLLK